MAYDEELAFRMRALLADEAAWQRFRADNDAAYTALGEQLAHLTLAQEELV